MPFHWLTGRAYQYRAQKFMGKRCIACGTTRNLVMHHVDQIEAHNTRGNLQTVCKRCHDAWHALAKHKRRKIAGRIPRGWKR